MDCLWREYLQPMQKDWGKADLAVQIAPDLETLCDLYRDMIGFRERIERIRTTTLVMQHQNNIHPNYFDCRLNGQKWPKYLSQIQLTFDHVTSLAA